MGRRALLDGLRPRLTLSIALILAVAGAITFIAIYRGTGSRLKARIDHDLRGQIDGFTRQGLPVGAASPSTARSAAARYVADQPFAASSRLLVAKIDGAGTVSNEPELLALGPAPDVGTERESRRTREEEHREARGLRDAPTGLSVVNVRDVGPVRLLTQDVRRGRRMARLSVGEPLETVDRAQDGIARTFAVIGSLTLLAAIASGYLLATRMTAPVRRMAHMASAIDAGDLSSRIEEPGARGEARVLAEAFNHMLDRLQAAFDRQRAFAADASHELRTPLTVVRGQIEVLARQPTASREDLRRVEAAISVEVARMQRLTDDLLLLARVDEQGPRRREPIEVQRFVRTLIDDFEQLGERRFELSARADGVLPGDPDLLAQVVRNLVRNAIEHTRADGGVIRLVAEARGDRLRLTVQDNGPGIPPAQRERVFDRFQRVDAARSRADGGAGLGLAIARGIVEAHGGTIRATEGPGGGALIVVELPGFVSHRESEPGSPGERQI